MRLEIANSNPMRIRVFMKLLKLLGITKKDIKIRIQYRFVTGGNPEKIKSIQKEWSNILEQPLNRFIKPSIRFGRHASRKYGTATLRVNNVFMAKLFIEWDKMFSAGSPQFPTA